MCEQNNLKKARDMGAQVAFYYAENGDTRHGVQGRQTIALVVTPEGTVYKGVTTCSLQDQFNKKKGRTYALGRAMQNLTKNRTGELVEYDTQIANRLIGRIRQREAAVLEQAEVAEQAEVPAEQQVQA